MSEISFDRYDYIIARKTVVVEKNDVIVVPNNCTCKISCGGVAFEYTGGNIPKSFCKKPMTVSVFCKSAAFEVPFKKDKECSDLVILLIRIPNPEATEGLLNKIPIGYFVHGHEKSLSFLFAHYDMEYGVRGLADYIHDRLYGSVMSGADEQALKKTLKDEFDMELVSLQKIGEVNE